jgi:heptaprenyl diphosphate synthase
MTPVVDIDAVRTEFLRRMTRGNLAILREVEQYATAQLGKMLRPRLTLAAAATLGTEVLHSRRTLLMAVCVEMLHNASLFHDDIIDRAATRRGQPSVNARWGNGVAVLVGDYILAQIMDLLDEVYDREAQHIVNGTV